MKYLFLAIFLFSIGFWATLQNLKDTSDRIDRISQLEKEISEIKTDKNTVIEFSEDGFLKPVQKIPYGSNIHIIVSEGKLIDVRLVDTKIPF